MPNTALVMSEFIIVLTTEQLSTRSGNAEERATERIRITLLWKIHCDQQTCLSIPLQWTSKTQPLIFNSVLWTGLIHTNLQTFSFFLPFRFVWLHTIYTINNQMQRKRYAADQQRQSNDMKLELIAFTSSFKNWKKELPDDHVHSCDETQKPHTLVQHLNLDRPYRTDGDWWENYLLQYAPETFAQTTQKLFFCSRSHGSSQSATN